MPLLLPQPPNRTPPHRPTEWCVYIPPVHWRRGAGGGGIGQVGAREADAGVAHAVPRPPSRGVCVCARARAREYVRVCVHVCIRMCVRVFASVSASASASVSLSLSVSVLCLCASLCVCEERERKEWSPVPSRGACVVSQSVSAGARAYECVCERV